MRPGKTMLPDLSDYAGITSPWLTVDVLTKQISDWGNYSVTVQGDDSVKVWDHDNTRHVVLSVPLDPFYFLRFADSERSIDWVQGT